MTKEEKFLRKYVKQLEESNRMRLEIMNFRERLILKYLVEIQKANKGIRRLRRKLDKCKRAAIASRTREGKISSANNGLKPIERHPQSKIGRGENPQGCNGSRYKEANQ